MLLDKLLNFLYHFMVQTQIWFLQKKG